MNTSRKAFGITQNTNILLVSFLFSILFTNFSFSQREISINLKNCYSVKKLESQKEEIKKEEKHRLKVEIDEIERRFADGELTEEEVKVAKKEAAEKRAKNIQNQLDVIEANVELMKRNEDDASNYYKNLNYLCHKSESSDDEEQKPKKKPRTTAGGMFAFGLNNLSDDAGFLNNSPFAVGKSQFVEGGLEFTTRLSPKGVWRIKYGLNLQLNNLKATNNQHFVNINNQVYLDTFPGNLSKTRFRTNNLVIPFHLEIGPTNDRLYATKFKFGIGGYAGVNLKTTQKLVYTDADGNRVRNKVANNFNTNNIVYGLSSYIGYDWFALYVKYDLNPLFDSKNNFNGNTVSAGIRVMF